MTADRKDLLAYARASIARGSKSFAAASRLLDRPTRERVLLLYAWCRACNDLAHGREPGGEAGLAAVRSLTARALAGEETGNPAFDAFGLVARECAITSGMAQDVIAGFALEAAQWRPRGEDDMLQYCYHVAGAVGVMVAAVMGVTPHDEDSLDRACDLGLAFELVNIARDIGADHAEGRCYLPEEWLAEAGIPAGEVMEPQHRKALAQLAARLCATARAYDACARIGMGRLGFRQRWAVLSAACFYCAIARKVERAGAGAWDARITLSAPERLGLVSRGLWQTLAEPPRVAERPHSSRRELAARGAETAP